MKLQEGEQIIHELRPEPSILVIWLFSKCLVIAVVGGFLSFFCFGFFGGILQASTKSSSFVPIDTCIDVVFIVAPTLFILGLIYCIFLWHTYVYYVTNQRCIFHGGILRKVERSVPYHKITDGETSQNIIESFLGISSLNIFTPGIASMQRSPFGGQQAEISFVGLSDNETPAISINEMLRKFKATSE